MIFYNLVILIKLYKIRYLNSDKAVLFRDTRLFVWKIENFDKLQLPQSLTFFAGICTHFLHNNVYKSVFGIFFILFRSWVINKNVKNDCVETRSWFLQITQDLTKIKKSWTPFCRHWYVGNVCKVLAKKYWTLY